MLRFRRQIRFVLAICVACACVALPQASDTARAQGVNRPLGLPFGTPPGPATWFVGQQFGNTSSAYNYGKYWYAAGQGLHFGIDFTAPCQTPVVAVADGIVDFVDNFSRGSAPHNLAVVHRDLGLVSFYGHLFRRATVVRGQPVKRGEVIALSGDPDSTCVSRPHLHLEVRNLNYTIAYNPAALIDADWQMLSSIGYQGRFAKDLYNPNRWQTIEDQPAVKFADRILNNYRAAWPPKQRYMAPNPTRPLIEDPPIDTAAQPLFERLTEPGCCSLAWWASDSAAVRYFDGPEETISRTYQQPLMGSSAAPVDGLTPVSVSPNGAYSYRWQGENIMVTRASDGRTVPLFTSGTWAAFSPNGTRLLWQRFPDDPVPGNAPPLTEVWVAASDGGSRELITTQTGGSVHWLDDERILLARRDGQTLSSTLSIYDLRTRSATQLFRAENIRGLSVSPGGASIIFWLSFQKDSSNDGIYLLESKAGAQPQKLSFFGSYRWRDSHTLIYIPYELGRPMQFVEYDLRTGGTTRLTEAEKQPFSILNDEWSIAPDGSKILYWDAGDKALWVVTLPTLAA